MIYFACSSITFERNTIWFSRDILHGSTYQNWLLNSLNIAFLLFQLLEILNKNRSSVIFPCDDYLRYFTSFVLQDKVIFQENLRQRLHPYWKLFELGCSKHSTFSQRPCRLLLLFYLSIFFSLPSPCFALDSFLSSPSVLLFRSISPFHSVPIPCRFFRQGNAFKIELKALWHYPCYWDEKLPPRGEYVRLLL